MAVKRGNKKDSATKEVASRTKRDFHKDLILSQWMMDFFKGGDLKSLKIRLGDDRFEGIEEDGQTKFFHELNKDLLQTDRINELELRRYDLHIVRYWKAITEGRNREEGTVLNLKYFQYLSLLCTEIYLDWYFNRKKELFDGLNSQIEAYNETEKLEFHLRPYEVQDLNKIAYWNATGSGKTLLLHVNIYQYLHYFQKANKNKLPDNIILLTPNEGMSRQHLGELDLSGFISSRIFNNRPKLNERTIDVIDIKKLRDQAGDKTVAVESFEGNNLILIDEGHLGTGTADGAWMRRRETLVSGGFAFEYSATFGQAIAKSSIIQKAEEDQKKNKANILFGTKNLKKLDDEQKERLALTSNEKISAKTEAMREVYAKCILFDYSYKYFYYDGYGKESLILNLKEEDYESVNQKYLYLTACLLSFYQQQYLWHKNREKLADFNIEKPLWVFVGNTVNSESSDILEVLKFLASFLNNEEQCKAWITDLKSDTARILDGKGRNIFQKRFIPLMSLSAEDIYRDILKKLFNTETRQRLKLVNLKGAKGEYQLQVGTSEPFGLINIGEGADFFKEAEKENNTKYFDVRSDEFDTSLFSTINRKDSRLNILIGSRKFMEGWSSWRVSTMGLLNMGKGEGSQIIQLFGRGVRLKGRDYSLKRSILSERPKEMHLEKLETLNIFGVNAGYMATFKEYLSDEGVSTSDEVIEINFETHTNLPKNRLNTLAIKDGFKDNQRKGFKRTISPWLYQIPEEFKGKIKPPHIELDLYPRIEALRSGEENGSSKSKSPDVKNTTRLSRELFAFFNFDRIFLELQKFKQENFLTNLRIERARLEDFCCTNDRWYTLYIPEDELKLKSFLDIGRQEDIFIQLLKDYTERFYKSLKSAYESQFYDIVPLKEENEAILKVYQFEIDNNDEGGEYQKRIQILQDLVKEGNLGEANKWSAGSMVAICFNSHLYYPLISYDKDIEIPLRMRPLSFDNENEVKFVRDLEAFYQSAKCKSLIADKSLYLLRNASHKSKGLGFALAGNFYPDFLLWLVDDKTGKQWLNFIDPKGLRQINLNDPKLGLYREIKIIEEKLGDPSLTLNAFILSHTPFEDLINVTCNQDELEGRNIIFMSEGRDEYLRKMFERVV